MSLAAGKIAKLLKRSRGSGRGYRTYCQRNENLIGVEPRIVVSEMIHLQYLNGLDYRWRYKIETFKYRYRGL